MKKIFSLFFTFVLLFGMSLNTEASDNQIYQFEVLSTTDMHGRAAAKNVSTQKNEINSMTKVATIVKKEKKTFNNKILLIDNGDLLQGNLISEFALADHSQQINPMVRALEMIGYNAWVMGKHEFNYTQLQRDTQAKIAKKAGIDILGGNIVLKSKGKNFYGKEVQKGQPFYPPYKIYSFDFGNGKIVKVALIGLSNANCASWDSPDNFPNLQFSSFDNPNGYIEKEISKYVKQIKKTNDIDIFIVSAHTGKTTDTGLQTDKFLLESQIVSGAQKSHDIDLFIYGHDHAQNIEKLKNADGKDVYIVNGGGTSVTKNVFTVKFDKNNKVSDYTVSAELLELKNYRDDKALKTEMNKWYEEAFNYYSKPIGTFTSGGNKYKNQLINKNNNDLVLEQTEINNFVHKVQLWASWLLYKEKNIKGATVSMTSSSMAETKNHTIAYIPKDNDKISLSSLSLIYKYGNNSLCVVDMKPAQLYNWMSKVADKLEINAQGVAKLKIDETLHGVDTFYGIDYAFDLTKPEGQRVVYAKINGINLLDVKTPVRVVLNNFRLAGGQGFYETTGLTVNDAVFTSSKSFPDDKISIQSLLGVYVKAKGKIKPEDTVEHSYNSAWKIYTKSVSKD